MFNCIPGASEWYYRIFKQEGDVVLLVMMKTHWGLIKNVNRDPDQEITVTPREEMLATSGW